MDPEASSNNKISFGVKKKVETKIETSSSVIQQEFDHSDEETENVAKKRKFTHLENGIITLDDEDMPSKKSKNNFVIPLVQEMDWRVARLKEMEKNGTISEEDRARLALLTEGEMTSTVVSTSTTTTEEISLVVEGTSTSIEDADYNAIPIESFGLAILRGCGWKDGEGIGKNPQVVRMRITQQRPKGLGLGAKPPKIDKVVKTKEEEEELSGELKQGSLVKIVLGKYTGKYGTVEGRDDDNSSCYVRLSIGRDIVRVSLFGVTKVTKKEYSANAHVLNRENYEIEAKRLEREREAQKAKNGDKKREDRTTKDCDYKDKTYRSFDDDKSIDKKEVWARPDLVVRFINDDYKKGRYMEQKMVIVDVADMKNLTLEDNEKKHHYQIKQSWIETVVPRDIGEKVMIVRGKNKGEIAVVEERDKKREMLALRLLSTDEIQKVSFDDACYWRPSLHYQSD
ncbi:unnamed protein product, partial [Mesorhabditis belari]|uniref:G-patch domain-containing protein n=1 Tax=Mesorhabditis belari TaxID=2138241 RepID=A0AAF3FHG9_9BILA